MMNGYKSVGAILLLTFLLLQQSAQAATDPLPSWKAGAAKDSIVAFVTAVTDKGGPDYVLPAERIATFANDGTLWSEKPVYFQLLFAIDRSKALAPQHPEWKTQQPFKAVLDGDLQMLQWTAAGDGRRFLRIVHHTDAEREWAYDRDSHVGRLDKALVESDKHGWTAVDMKRDWEQIYPADK